jgi:hypothetical protein
MEIPDDADVRPMDPVQNMRLIDDPMDFHHHVVEEDPELELAIALSIASYEENQHRAIETESNEQKAIRLLREREEEEEKRRQEERENRHIYKDALRPHFQQILSISKTWHRIPDLKPKANLVEMMINRYYQQSAVYMYINEEEYHTFYDILKEMQDGSKNRNTLSEMDKMVIQDHIRLLEEF